MKLNARTDLTRRFCSSAFALLLLIATLPFLTGCATAPKTTKLQKFPLMYEEKPVTVLVLQPINNTTAADAKEYYATTIATPLAFSGFYVIPVDITADILKSQGMSDTEMFANQPVAKMGEYFGADAVLYTQINEWDTSYAVIASTMTVSISAMLKSTKTERTLWEYNGTVKVDLSGGSTSSGNPLADLIAKVIVTAINTAVADYVPYAMQANFLVLSTIPVGKYHPNHDKDQSVIFFDQTAVKRTR